MIHLALDSNHNPLKKTMYKSSMIADMMCMMSCVKQLTCTTSLTYNVLFPCTSTNTKLHIEHNIVYSRKFSPEKSSMKFQFESHPRKFSPQNFWCAIPTYIGLVQHSAKAFFAKHSLESQFKVTPIGHHIQGASRAYEAT